MTVPPMKLETKRLCLEPVTTAHADALWAAIRPSVDELKRWLAWAVYASLDETRRFTERAERGWQSGTEWDFVITMDGEAIGNIGLNRFIPLWRSCNMGYWIRSDVAGRGLMTEAASAAVDFAFTHANAHRIELAASPENPASWRIAEKIGFQREGLQREGCWTDLGFMDMYLYGLLATDPRMRFH